MRTVWGDTPRALSNATPRSSLAQAVAASGKTDVAAIAHPAVKFAANPVVRGCGALVVHCLINLGERCATGALAEERSDTWPKADRAGPRCSLARSLVSIDHCAQVEYRMRIRTKDMDSVMDHESTYDRPPPPGLRSRAVADPAPTSRE